MNFIDMLKEAMGEGQESMEKLEASVVKTEELLNLIKKTKLDTSYRSLTDAITTFLLTFDVRPFLEGDRDIAEEMLEAITLLTKAKRIIDRNGIHTETLVKRLNSDKEKLLAMQADILEKTKEQDGVC